MVLRKDREGHPRSTSIANPLVPRSPAPPTVGSGSRDKLQGQVPRKPFAVVFLWLRLAAKEGARPNKKGGGGSGGGSAQAASVLIFHSTLLRSLKNAWAGNK